MSGYNGNPYAAPSPLAAPRAHAPPSQIPTDQLAAQADQWRAGQLSSPAPPNAAPSRASVHQYQPQPQPAYQQPPPAGGGAYGPGGYGVGGPNAHQQNFNQQQQQPQQAYYNQQQPQMQQQQFQGYQSPQPGQQPFRHQSQPPPGQWPHQQPQQPYNNPQPPQSSVSLDGAAPSDGYRAPPTGAAPPRRQLYATPEDGPPHKLSVNQPDVKMLESMREMSLSNGGDAVRKVAWAKQVLKYIERTQASAGESSRINDPTLVRWTDEALNNILQSAASQNPVPLALYLRGDLSTTGSFPSYRSKDSKSAFRDFESAANAGYVKAWFRIGRAYEEFGDVRRAVGAYEKGVEKGDCGSTYRLAMAYLLGQIGVQPEPTKAIALLTRAADMADLDTPQPPYILGMLLCGEFDSPNARLPSDLVQVDYDEAKARIERSAFLAFGPAQYKMGFAYEYASVGCLFDPLLSVQYYALASQNGEVEADMSLSKWYLCGSEGNFAKDEKLAFTFAEKAASKGLPAGEFALGYYAEVGIHLPVNLEQAKRWYARAASHGNTDARDRLQALGASNTHTLSRNEHEQHVDTRLVRKRTQAKQRSDQQRESMAATQLANNLAGGAPPPRMSSHQQYPSAPEQTSVRRRDTLRQVEAAAAGYGPRRGASEMGQQQYGNGYGYQQQGPPQSGPTPAQQIRQQYQLSDGPSPSGARLNGRPSPSVQPAPPPQRPKEHATFAEMGVATKKAEKDDCVVM